MVILVSQLQKLLQLNQQALDYHVEMTTLLCQQLPITIRTPVPHSPANTTHLRRKIELIDKYRPKFPQLIHPGETATVFRTIYDFIHPDLIAIASQIRQWLASNDYPELLTVILRYLYPNQYLDALSYLSTELQWDADNNQSQLEMLDRVGYDIPQAALVKNQLECVLKETMSLYPTWESKQSQLFLLLIQRDLLMDVLVSSDGESTYENTILTAILHNLGLDLPPTYVGNDALVYEVMETLTFHLDVIPTLASLVLDYNRSLNTKVAYMRQRHMPFGTVRYFDGVNEFLSSVALPQISDIITQGPRGLTDISTFTKLRDTLSRFRLVLNQFIPYVNNNEDVCTLCRDELYFAGVFKEYTVKFNGLIDMITSSDDPAQLVTGDRRGFEEIDNDLKDLIFDLLHFEHRFDNGQSVVAEMKLHITHD